MLILIFRALYYIDFSTIFTGESARKTKSRRTKRNFKKWKIISEKSYFPWLEKGIMKAVLMKGAEKLKAYLDGSLEPY
jgi:hypothetical protein